MTDYEKAVALWQQKQIATDADLAEALNGYSIMFAYHSGKIENDRITYHDTREIFEHDGVTSYTGDLRTLFEIRNEKEAYEFFLNAFKERHPFADGNGRAGRLAMNYLLVLHNHPPVIIHEEDRKSYYEALEAWDSVQELDPLRTFLKEQTVKSWRKRITRLSWPG